MFVRLLMASLGRLRLGSSRGLWERLGDGASVLDVGCGTGVPIARALVEAGRVIAVHAESSQ